MKILELNLQLLAVGEILLWRLSLSRPFHTWPFPHPQSLLSLVALFFSFSSPRQSRLDFLPGLGSSSTLWYLTFQSGAWTGHSRAIQTLRF